MARTGTWHRFNCARYDLPRDRPNGQGRRGKAGYRRIVRTTNPVSIHDLSGRYISSHRPFTKILQRLRDRHALTQRTRRSRAQHLGDSGSYRSRPRHLPDSP